VGRGPHCRTRRSATCLPGWRPTNHTHPPPKSMVIEGRLSQCLTMSCNPHNYMRQDTPPPMEHSVSVGTEVAPA
jgi:hypothetical protein